MTDKVRPATERCSFSVSFDSGHTAVPRASATTSVFVPDTAGILVKAGIWTLTHWEASGVRCEITWQPGKRSSEVHLRASTLKFRNLSSGDVNSSPAESTKLEGGGWRWEATVQSPDYKERFVVEMVLELVDLASHSEVLPHRLFAWVQESLESPHFYDVTFIFPGRDQRTLQANSRVLAAASPYFATLLAAGFSERTSSVTGKSTFDTERISLDATIEPSEPSHDSDDEETPLPRAPTARYEIKVTEASYKTYRAVLIWILTGWIRFTSATPSRPTTPASDASLGTSSSPPLPTSPPPSSPQSIYRLADFLELPKLKSLALASILAHLDVANVAEELMSDLCAHYEPVQEAMVDFAASEWVEVKESEGWKELKKRVDAGDEDVPEWSTQICMRLLQRLSS